MRGARLGAVARRRRAGTGTRRGSRAASRARAAGAPRSSRHAGREALGERHHVRERLLGQHVLERRAHRGERERVAGQRAADAAGVLVVGLGLRDMTARRRRPQTPSAAAGTPPPIALPIVTMSGSRPQAPRAAAGAGAERVRLVDHQQRPGAARELAQRVVEPGAPAARCRCSSAPARRARTATSPRRERRLERVDVVELDDLRRQRGVDGRPDVAGSRRDGAAARVAANASSTEPW